MTCTVQSHCDLLLSVLGSHTPSSTDAGKEGGGGGGQ